ncbi:hypothetical protein C448_04629 [Halococcus morrhuae DSM 1307]|uniref:DUF433 domain-containing protein n=1 Tax=Halococcus morrhuae DSM 1307 TaxID=931277 RepID=M0MSH0_HALMO|nr:DUF433 domain-containing protein [Halococcus morrhuae]EMA47694.1 hypothetical protein C448_04629 [Halococcus morrhuae DSM 1307]
MAEIVSTPEVLGGKPRIEGRRIGVHQVVSLVVDGNLMPEEMAVRYDLELADIHRAITYYYDNPEEIRAVQKRRQENIENADPIRPEDLGIEPRDTADPKPRSDD